MRKSSSENPFTRAFWLGGVDPRPLAIFRILFGLVLLHDLADYAFDIRAFLTDGGMLPRSAIHDRWLHGLFDLVGTESGVVAIYAVGCLAVVAFTVGFHTRIATVASWVFLTSLHHRNIFVVDGADDLARVMLLWSVIADLGARYSVDAWRAPIVPSVVPAFGARLMQAQVAALYLVTAILKLRAGWLHGDGVFLTLQLDGYQRPLGAWLLMHPTLCVFSARIVPIVELLIPIAAFSPLWPRASRMAVIAMGLGLQLGIMTTMRIGMFTELMIVVLALWIPSDWIDRVERARGHAPVTRDELAPPSRMRRAVDVIFALQFIVAVWDPFLGRRLPLPRVVREERLATSVVMGYSLFDLVYTIPRWEASGRLEDGTPVEVLSAVAPGMRPRGPGLRHSRWSKITFKSFERPLAMRELGAYICRAHDEKSRGPRLATFTLVNWASMPRTIGAKEASRARREELLQYTCDGVDLPKDAVDDAVARSTTPP